MARKSLTGAAAALLLVALMPSVALANDAGSNISNFSESRGCAPNVAGPSRPYVGVTGPMGTSTQIRGPWGDMYGRTYYQVEQSLVSWRIPGTSRVIRAHERSLPALQRVAAALERNLAEGRSYSIYSAGSWVWRTVGGRTQPSEHAFGTAIDINPANNPYSGDNRLRTNIPQWFVDAFAEGGYCWGGDWVDVKDAMHFSWSGPATTPGSTRPAPYPPVTSSTGYRGPTLAFTSVIGVAPSSRITIADVTGEGAPDIARLQVNGRIEAADSVGNYRTVALRTTTRAGAQEGDLADYDLDGRADAWVPDRSGETVRFDVFTWASDFRTAVSLTTGIPSSASKLMLGHFDDDFRPDVYAVVGGAVNVYGSTTGYGSVTVQLPLPSGADPNGTLMTGDHDVDGRSDVYAVTGGTAPRLRVRLAAGGEAVLDPAVSIPQGAQTGLGDYDGDGREDLFVVDGTAVTVALGGLSSGAPDAWFQTPKSLPTDAGPECTGSACDTIGYVDPGGVWTLADRPRTEAKETAFYYGNPNDVPFMGDWDCDGVETPGLYRRSDGFVYLRNSNTQGVADLEFFFGNPSDVPLAGDFDGDGCDTVSVFRPSEQRIYVINELGQDNGGLGAADFFFDFGDFGDRPFVGDFDGDGADEVALHRPATAQVLLKWDLSGGSADAVFPFGDRGDIALAGDWNGDGTDTVSMYRPSEGNWYIRLANAAGMADHVIHFHAHDDEVTLPVVGHAFP